MTSFTLDSLIHPNSKKSLGLFQQIETKNKRSFLILFDPKPHDTGFDFYVARWCCSDAGDKNNEYECLFHGTAYFDGVRHLYMGDGQTDTEGYIYYPESGSIIDIFTKLKELELIYCIEQ